MKISDICTHLQRAWIVSPPGNEIFKGSLQYLPLNLSKQQIFERIFEISGKFLAAIANFLDVITFRGIGIKNTSRTSDSIIGFESFPVKMILLYGCTVSSLSKSIGTSNAYSPGSVGMNFISKRASSSGFNSKLTKSGFMVGSAPRVQEHVNGQDGEHLRSLNIMVNLITLSELLRIFSSSWKNIRLTEPVQATKYSLFLPDVRHRRIQKVVCWYKVRGALQCSRYGLSAISGEWTRVRPLESQSKTRRRNLSGNVRATNRRRFCLLVRGCRWLRLASRMKI